MKTSTWAINFVGIKNINSSDLANLGHFSQNTLAFLSSFEYLLPGWSFSEA